MNNIFYNRQDFFSLNDPPEYEYKYEEDGHGYQNLYQKEYPQPIPEEDRRWLRRMEERFAVASEQGMESTMNNVVTMPGTGNTIVVIEPRSLEEMPQVIQALRERKTVVLKLTMIDPQQAQRAVDFVAGGTYSIEGHQERIGERVFLFTPSCVQVTRQSGFGHKVPQPQMRLDHPMAPTHI